MDINICKGKTKKNTQCTKKVKNGDFCYYHKISNIDKLIEPFKSSKYCKKQKECKICYENVNKRVILPCSHKLCNMCIKKLNSFDCPFCRNNIINILNKTQINYINNNIRKIKKEQEINDLNYARNLQSQLLSQNNIMRHIILIEHTLPENFNI